MAGGAGVGRGLVERERERERRASWRAEQVKGGGSPRPWRGSWAAVGGWPNVARRCSKQLEDSRRPRLAAAECMHFSKEIAIMPNLIDGAGLDDSTSPPSLVLCLRDAMHNVIFAKPGDEQWTLGSPGEASHRLFDWHGRIAFQSLARCYFSPEGSVCVLQLQPLPRHSVFRYRNIYSFLVGAGTWGGCC